MQCKLRCAIYTRKSSEEGLEQGFNSLHAQREACEAYVLSQAGEGWTALKTLYDDGGFSGGSMERPGLKALLADIAAGRIDIVVVYKVDRLTRSLMDFAKIVETFDQQGISFVSVTQAFNTTTSIGRLTLNVLLSFAQFEREVTGERIRDKIAASKAKGMWMGGQMPLGYDPPSDPLTRALVVNQAEAEVVRLIFSRYLELGSVHLLVGWLKQEDIRSKTWVTRKGRSMGGYPFNRGALFHLLRNRTYVGEIPHKDKSYPGAHTGIVDPAIFDRVQTCLENQVRRHRERPSRVATMMLKGLIFDADGEAMSPTFTHRGKDRVYRYYVSTTLQKGIAQLPSNDLVSRVSAELVEGLVQGCVDRLSGTTSNALQSTLLRVEVHPATLQLLLRRSALFKHPGDAEAEIDSLRSRLKAGERIASEPQLDGVVRVTLPCRLQRRGGRTRIIDDGGRLVNTQTAPDPILIKALIAAHQALCGEQGRLGAVEDLMLQATPSSAYDRLRCKLAFLAPDIQKMILEGRQGAHINLAHLLAIDLPGSWNDQRRMLQIPC